MHLNLKIKSLMMSDFELTLLIDLRHFNALRPSLLAAMRPLLRLESVFYPGPTAARGLGSA